MKHSEREPIWSWTHAGFGAAVLAVVLAGVGLVVAIRQTQAVSVKRIADLRPEARSLAAEINTEIVRQVRAILQDPGMGRAGTARIELPSSAAYPAWIPVVFVYDGRPPRRVFPPRDGPQAVSDDDWHRVELIAPRLNLRLHARTAVGDVQFLHDSIGGQHVIVAHLPLPAGDAPAVIAALLEPHRLRSDLIERLLATHADLALTGSTVRANAWGEPLGPALPFLAIRPSDAFVSAQHRSALRQTLLYVGVMLLVLAALLMMLQGTARVARREVELSRLKSEFVADVSHELKTPLALIQMFAETLLEGRARTEEKKQEYYEIITRETKRLTHLINNILDFSRIDSGKRIYKMQRVRVENIARSVYEAYRHELDRKGFEHKLIAAEGLPEVDADPDAISQVLLNLISNTLKYSDEDRWLAVELAHETRRGRRGVLISLRDRGIGIRPEDRAHLFDGFFRAQDDKVRKRRGAGLGLALVRNIVEAHQGFVEMESRLVKGTTFHIFLPECREHNEVENDG